MRNDREDAHLIHRHVDSRAKAEWLAAKEQRKGIWADVWVEPGFADTWHVVGVKEKS